MDAIFTAAFEKSAKVLFNDRIPEKKSDRPTNAQIAAGSAAGSVSTRAIYDSVSNYAKDVKENISGNMTNTRDAFMKKLKPGDVIYSGYNPKDSFDVMLGKKIKAPLKVSQMVQLVTGNPNYHGMIYLGNGLIAQAEGAGEKLSIRRLKNELKGQRVKAYRPTAATSKEIKSAISYAKKVKGTRYKTDLETLGQGINMLFAPGGGKKTCRKTKDGIVCNTLITKAYPKQFPRENMSINQVRKSKGVKFVGGIDNIKKSPLSDKVINRVVNPVMKNLKWALPAAAVGVLGNEIMKRVKSSKPDSVKSVKAISKKMVNSKPVEELIGKTKIEKALKPTQSS